MQSRMLIHCSYGLVDHGEVAVFSCCLSCWLQKALQLESQLRLLEDEQLIWLTAQQWLVKQACLDWRQILQFPHKFLLCCFLCYGIR